MPFNIRTPLGYLVYSVLTYTDQICIVFNVEPAVWFLVGCSWLFICFGNDAKNDLLLLNVRGKKRNHVEVKRRVCNILRTYSDAKELSINYMLQY